jgi:hypothetical protein
MKRWAIWNRGYTRKVFEAPTIEEAMQLAKDQDHIRKGYRRFAEVTEESADT